MEQTLSKLSLLMNTLNVTLNMQMQDFKVHNKGNIPVRISEYLLHSRVRETVGGCSLTYDITIKSTVSFGTISNFLLLL